MKAIINQELVKKTRTDRSILPVTVIGTKENIVNKVNNYISNRLTETNKIQVKCFHVTIYAHNEKKVNNWDYTPTYK